MNILITAGATWVRIDDVRIITSVFTGQTGVFLAKEFMNREHNVTLLLNSHCNPVVPDKIRVLPFHYFEELEISLEKELKTKTYEAIIHCAAVSDYKLKSPFKGKLPSGEKELLLRLSPASKLINRIRSLAKDSYLVQFKLEISRHKLIEKALLSMRQNRSDMVVANAYEDLREGYRAVVIDKIFISHQIVSSKKELFDALYTKILA